MKRGRDQQPSAQPSAASGIRTATVKQLIDALVVRATGKADFEIAHIVSEITERLNELKAHTHLRLEIRPTPILATETLVQGVGKKTGIYRITKSSPVQK